MLLIVGTIRLLADRMGAARSAMQHMIEASRAEDGCLDYAYAQDALDPGLIHVTERWTDEAAPERHFASPHLAQWRGSWAELGIGERQLCLYTAGEARPI